MKVETIKDREKSNAHISAEKISTAAAGSIVTTPTVQGLTAMTDVTAMKMKNLFRTVHALAKPVQAAVRHRVDVSVSIFFFTRGLIYQTACKSPL